MGYGFVYYHILLLLFFVIRCLSLHDENISVVKVLNVGEELEMESLALKQGQRLFDVHGLKDSAWYEIKISYPASIPTSFSIQLTGDASGLWSGKNRKLLNTEKLIFKGSSYQKYVLVTAECAGVVAQKGAHEREFVFFNIVCDELSFGIPHKAWCVGTVAIVCLLLAFIIPRFLPSDFFSDNQGPEPINLDTSKIS